MHTDFHLYGTYLAARIAKFSKEDAELIAFAAQAVDDFNFGEYASCRSLGESVLSNPDIIQTTWTLFHFLPANFNNTSVIPEKRFRTAPNSQLSENMESEFISLFRGTSELGAVAREKKLAVAGVVMHVLADTYAHQGFSGLKSTYNIISDVEITSYPKKIKPATFSYLPAFIAKLFPKFDIGHGTAGHMPDISWITYKYKDSEGKEMNRSNPEIFANAFAKMVKILLSAKNETTALMDDAYTAIYNYLKNYAGNIVTRIPEKAVLDEGNDNVFKEMLSYGEITSLIPDICPDIRPGDIKNNDAIDDSKGHAGECLRVKYNVFKDKINEMEKEESVFMRAIQEKNKTEEKKDDITQRWDVLQDMPFFFAGLWHRNNILPLIWSVEPNYPVLNK